jgi:hypothetical protein
MGSRVFGIGVRNVFQILQVDWNGSSANVAITLMEMESLLNVEFNFSLVQFIYQLGPLFWLALRTASKHVASWDMGGSSTWEPSYCSERNRRTNQCWTSI